MNKERKLLLGILITGLFLITSCGSKSNDKSPNTQRPQQGLAIKGLIVGYSPLEQQLILTGTILPDEVVELHAETPGKLVELNIEEGQKVTKGQLLARVNDNEIRARMKKLNLDLDLARQDVERKVRLKEINALSQQEVDIAQNKVDGLKADMDLAKAQIEKSEVRAPFDGIIGLRNVSPGGYISVTTTLATLVKNNPVKIEFSVPERFVEGISKGKEIEFSLGHHPKKYNARIYATEAGIDLGTRALKVRALAQNQQGELTPGSFAKVFFTVNGTPQAILIPPHALIPVLGGQSVAKLDKGRVNMVTVETGTRTSTSVEVVTGLAPGDTLLTSGLLQIRQGMPVRVTIEEKW
jgi:membrane fusion protein (multidrug efflux system)